MSTFQMNRDASNVTDKIADGKQLWQRWIYIQVEQRWMFDF